MDLETLIENYHVSDATTALVRQTNIVTLVGVSGAGKDTIQAELLKNPDYSRFVTCTTRLPRANNGIMETNGVEYFFIDQPEAARMLTAGEFVEAKFVHGNVYGTPVKEVERISREHKIAVMSIDVQGAAEYKKIAPGIVSIFIVPPSYEEWRSRLSKRYASEAEFEAEWPVRRDSAIMELRHALEVPYYHFIINDDLARAVRVTGEIAHRPDMFFRKDDEARLAARDILEEITKQIAER